MPIELTEAWPDTVFGPKLPAGGVAALPAPPAAVSTALSAPPDAPATPPADPPAAPPVASAPSPPPVTAPAVPAAPGAFGLLTSASARMTQMEVSPEILLLVERMEAMRRENSQRMTMLALVGGVILLCMFIQLESLKSEMRKRA